MDSRSEETASRKTPMPWQMSGSRLTPPTRIQENFAMTLTKDRSQRIRLATRAVEDGRLFRVWRQLEAAELHPVLIKGWSTARLYPDPDQRPLGDIDLCFSPDELPRALALRSASVRDFADTDYHEGVRDLPDRSWTEIFSRTLLVPVQGTTIRVLGLEDHLRLICRHMARHGACSRRMLEDLAATLDALPEDFDWDECLRGDECESQWVLAFVALAGRLLGAQIQNPRIRERAACPEWLVEDLPHIWNAWEVEHSFPNHTGGGWEALRYSWLNPVRASFCMGTLPRTRTKLAMTLAGFLCWRRLPTLALRPLRPLEHLLRGGVRRPRPEFHRT